MKITCLSDTHGSHACIQREPADVVIFAGDWSSNQHPSCTYDFLRWFHAWPAPVKIMIAGNHDGMAATIKKRPFKSVVKRYAPGVIYLQDSWCKVNGLKVYGSPYTPEFFQWYFMQKRGIESAMRWEKIPDDTDILVTHGPPMGTLDLVGREHTGCYDLHCRIRELPHLKLHAFGHIHCARGAEVKDGVRYVNASILDESYVPVYKPISVEL